MASVKVAHMHYYSQTCRPTPTCRLTVSMVDSRLLVGQASADVASEC